MRPDYGERAASETGPDSASIVRLTRIPRPSSARHSTAIKRSGPRPEGARRDAERPPDFVEAENARPGRPDQVSPTLTLMAMAGDPVRGRGSEEPPSTRITSPDQAGGLGGCSTTERKLMTEAWPGIRAVLAVERSPSHGRWVRLCERHGVILVWQSSSTFSWIQSSSLQYRSAPADAAVLSRLRDGGPVTAPRIQALAVGVGQSRPPSWTRSSSRIVGASPTSLSSSDPDTKSYAQQHGRTTAFRAPCGSAEDRDDRRFDWLKEFTEGDLSGVGTRGRSHRCSSTETSLLETYSRSWMTSTLPERCFVFQLRRPGKIRSRCGRCWLDCRGWRSWRSTGPRSRSGWR